MCYYIAGQASLGLPITIALQVKARPSKLQVVSISLTCPMPSMQATAWPGAETGEAKARSGQGSQLSQGSKAYRSTKHAVSVSMSCAVADLAAWTFR